MPKLESLFLENPFQRPQAEKEALYSEFLSGLTNHHRQLCKPYRKILEVLQFDEQTNPAPKDYPYLPVRLFKEFELKSQVEERTVKRLVSSGTTGQKTSQIYLDSRTAANQTKALQKIVADFIGSKRRPLLVLDNRLTIQDRERHSARAAGIRGFSLFGSPVHFGLTDSLQVNESAIHEFLKLFGTQDFLLFGFTHIVWESFQALATGLDFSRGTLIHGGGWKKLEAKRVDNETFKSHLQSRFNLRRVHNYYGMVEQAGSIFMECSEGVLHASAFSDILVRRPDFSLARTGETGLIELLSLLPTSYPGHVILTEDMGRILGTDDCRCGRKGRYFQIEGRAPRAEIRGCSNVTSA